VVVMGPISMLARAECGDLARGESVSRKVEAGWRECSVLKEEPPFGDFRARRTAIIGPGRFSDRLLLYRIRGILAARRECGPDPNHAELERLTSLVRDSPLSAKYLL